MATWVDVFDVGFGVDCHGRFVRMGHAMHVENIAVLIRPDAARWITLPALAVGFCYSARPGVLYVGFDRTFAPVERAITQYDYCVVLMAARTPPFEILV